MSLDSYAEKPLLYNEVGVPIESFQKHMMRYATTKIFINSRWGHVLCSMTHLYNIALNLIFIMLTFGKCPKYGRRWKSLEVGFQQNGSSKSKTDSLTTYYVIENVHAYE